MITKEQIKTTGATFTPRELSVFLAERIAFHAQSEHKRVLDPACGDGELLLAMSAILKDNNANFTLTGFDANKQYLNRAKDRLINFEIEKMELIHQDFLQAVDISNTNKPLSLFDEQTSEINSSFDIVIANPPYVRTQILGAVQAQSIAKKFNLKGRVDLYYPFLIAMTESLKEGGVLGVITSNRYLSTKSGESVRKYLSQNYAILELIDLGDTKLFDAAVLPAIFIGRKEKQKALASANFIKIYEELNGYTGELIKEGSIYDIMNSGVSGYFMTPNGKRYKKSIGTLKYKVNSTECWEMLSNNESGWVSKITQASKNRVSDFFKVRVGIKSTADSVFISDKWNELKDMKPEDELLKELISQENIEPWHSTHNSTLKVLYPHISIGGKKETIDIDKFPIAKEYLIQHQEKLKSRKYLIDAGREWFELWVPHRPDLWKFPKLVFPDISTKPRFYFDNGGKIVNGNCYWIVALDEKEIDKLLLVQGVANSKLMTKYHDLVFNNKLYSGRRRYFSQYVEKYPLPDFDSPKAKEIINIVKKLNQLDSKSTIPGLEHELEIKIAESFGVEPIFTLD
jgi:adenine-specific DNA-methyltransferase